MTPLGWLQIVVLLAVTFALGWPLGSYMASVYEGEAHPLARIFGAVERGLHRLAGTSPSAEQTWRQYAVAVLLFNGIGFLVVFALQLAQGLLPGNPAGLGGVTWHSAFNTAVSFMTNTNWQGYGGESTMSYLTQMLGLAVQNFFSAATGMAVAVALARAIYRAQTDSIGNFWVDATRSILYILLPLAFVFALLLVSQGVVQSFAPYVTATTTEGATQTIALGPAASQIAIKQLGTNGGGFFNANSAHPFENPTPFSNALQTIAILVTSVGFCRLFGRLVRDERQGRALFAAMTVMFLPFLLVVVLAEAHGNPIFTQLGVDMSSSDWLSGGNMEGKEVRFGIAGSSLWAAATTAASNGSVNSMHDSFTPLGGFAPMFLILLGEVVYGGVGAGLYGLIMFAIVAVFVAGLMVGRTPEYVGKKIEAHEMKMASIAIIAPCAMVLVGTAVSVATELGLAGVFNPGPHGFSEVLYGWASASNNNGSAFAGLGANTPFYNIGLGVAMLVGRFFVMLPTLAIAGSLARKKSVPAGPGTLPTHDTLFIVLLVGTVMLVGALNFVPALALGPIVEHLSLGR